MDFPYNFITQINTSLDYIIYGWMNSGLYYQSIKLIIKYKSDVNNIQIII